MVQVQQFETGNRYQLEILHQFGKRVKTKSRNVFGASSYVCSYKGKTMFEVIGEKLVRGLFDRPPPPSWIGLKYFLERPQHKFFLVNIAKFFIIRILKNICKRLLFSFPAIASNIKENSRIRREHSLLPTN